jgi:hypothetical protein
MTLAKVAGVRCLVTAGSDEKCAQCREMGAYAAINYKEHNFPDEVYKIEKVRAGCQRAGAGLGPDASSRLISTLTASPTSSLISMLETGVMWCHPRPLFRPFPQV